MKANSRIRVAFASALMGSTLYGASCESIARDSLREGSVNFLRGSVAQSLDSQLLGDFLLNIVTGGFNGGGGDRDNGNLNNT